ncbi:tyrosine-type recombinase/integrase [Vibrio sp. 10N.222.52.C3]|uniref:tyrosine-type recombinase/integrase n=1 Tax=Vibrio sp. 10N.222.52.C3 TaxID=3229631 RepID=UPI00354EF6F2
MALTDSKLKGLLKGHDSKRPTKHTDGLGFYVLAHRTGVVTFMFKWNTPDRKERNIKLGVYTGRLDGITLAAAREKADQCRGWVREGRDPKIELQILRSNIRNAVSVREALEHWFEGYADKKRKNATKHRLQFERHIYPYIGDLPVEEVTTRHWIKVFEDIKNGTHHRPAPVAAGYIFGNVKQALIYCRKRHFCTTHALDDLTITDVGEKQAKKDRVLSWSEICELWQWTHDEKHNWYYRQLAKLLISFGARTQEVRLSKIKEWDLKAMVWVCPKAHSKNDKEVSRPIPDGLGDYIKTLIAEARRNKSPYLLGELKQAPSVSLMGGKLHKRMSHDKWNLHDLRRSLATHLSDAGIEPHVIESLLGHTLGGVAGIYNRSQYLEQKRAALNLWQKKLTATSNPNANVVNFK